MFRWILCAALAFAATTGIAEAQCVSYPYNLADGTTADATQVMANFNCAALLGGANFTGSVNITSAAASSPLTVTTTAGQIAVITANGNNYDTRIRLNNVAAASTSNTSSIDLAVESSVTHRTAALLEASLSDTDDTTKTSQLVFMDDVNGSLVASMTLAGPNLGIGTTTPSALLTVNGAALATAWNTTSDARLKKDVVEIPDALTLVERLRGVRFQWRPVSEREIGKELNLPVDKPQLGFIAQEVAQVVPEAVDVPRSGSSEIYTLKEDDLVPILVEAVKAQQAEIERLQAAVLALKSK